MADDELTFALYPGEIGVVPLPLFLNAVADVQRLLIDVAYAVTRDKYKGRWIVTNLHSSAPTVTLRATSEGPETMDTLSAGLQSVVSGEAKEPPIGFTVDALADLKKMHRLFWGKERAQRLVFSRDGSEIAAINRNINRQVEQILRQTYTVLGSLEGTLEAVNLHGRPVSTLWDRLSGAPVRCYFPRTLTQLVKDHLEKRVLVRGEVRYFRSGIPQYVNVWEIRDRTPDESRPKGDFGSIPDLTGGVDAVEYVRAMRESVRPDGNTS
ncbi:MAG TPA: hypothetical protein VK009_00680 [Chloroflexota bacterium]|nr:hypothetical protein [Chloroflexota bacterium]